MVQHIGGGLRGVELELRDALEIETLDERLRIQMRAVLDAIHGIKGNLVLLDMRAREVLDQVLRDTA